MALRDQPYLPLFIQDFLTDEKLAECSASATGVYIRLMCLMHKSEDYGKILLKQKYKQSDKQILNFALQVAKNLPYDLLTVQNALIELLEENVIHIEGEYLLQKRMVNDGLLSEKRSKSGSKGGKKTQRKNKEFASKFAKAKVQANTEYEYEYENEIVIENEIKNKKGQKPKKPKPPKFEIEPGVKLTEEEKDNLIVLYGSEVTFSAIGYLSSYKQEKPSYKTASDYLTIRRWVIDAVTKSKSHVNGNTKAGQSAFSGKNGGFKLVTESLKKTIRDLSEGRAEGIDTEI
jgi:hypothetical protein